MAIPAQAIQTARQFDLSVSRGPQRARRGRRTDLLAVPGGDLTERASFLRLQVAHDIASRVGGFRRARDQKIAFRLFKPMSAFQSPHSQTLKPSRYAAAMTAPLLM
jgi:hypothetical protein